MPFSFLYLCATLGTGCFFAFQPCGHSVNAQLVLDLLMCIVPQVDYLKVDSCGADGPGTEWEQFAAMRDALNATGRPVYLSICEITEDEGVRDGCLGRNIVYSPKMWFGQGKDVATLGNSILVEYSNNGNSFQAVKCTMEAQQRLTFDNLTRPGSWNDNDVSRLLAMFSVSRLNTCPLPLLHQLNGNLIWPGFGFNLSCSAHD